MRYCGGGATAINHGVRNVGFVSVLGCAYTQVLRRTHGHLFVDLRSNPDLRVVVFPQVWHVIHRAGVAHAPRAVAGRRRRGAGAGRGGVQGLAQPAVAAARRGVRPPVERRAPRAAHLLRHESVGAGTPSLVRLRS